MWVFSPNASALQDSNITSPNIVCERRILLHDSEWIPASRERVHANIHAVESPSAVALADWPKRVSRERIMAKKASNGLSGMSITAIHRELRKRATKAKSLARRRDALLAKAARLDAQIRDLGGAGARPIGSARMGITARGTPRKRPQNETGLAEALYNTLKGKTMGVTEVANAVVHAGYKTTAENFRTIVNQALLKHRKLFKKVSRGQYTSN
jgi:hypothetical protein